MDIGYFRFKDDILKTREINAMAYAFYGMNLIFFGPEDIDKDSHTVKGKYLTPDGWKRKTVPLPKIINNMRIKADKSKHELYKYLDDNSYLLFHSFGSKEKVESLLKKNNLITDLLIPSRIIKGLDDIISLFEDNKKILFKPLDGMKGKGIFTLEKEEDFYLYKDETNIKKFNQEDLLSLGNQINNKYIGQKFLQSRTVKDLPFDLRVQYEKNRKGQWVKAQVYARVGLTNELVSNIAKGGSVIRGRSFLINNYGLEKGKMLYEKLEEQLKGFPKKFESLFDFNVNSIALDFGLDQEDFYLFEINSFPGGTFARGEIAYLRAGYTKYLVENKLNEPIKMGTDLIKENVQLNKENEALKQREVQLNNELKKMKNSRSWRYTSILRKK